MLVSLLFLILLSAVNYYQSAKEFSQRKMKEVERNDSSIKETFTYLLAHNNVPADSIFSARIFEMGNIYNSKINIYKTDGGLIASNNGKEKPLERFILNRLMKEKKIVKDSAVPDSDLVQYNSYSYIVDSSRKPIAILNIQISQSSTSVLPQFAELFKQNLLIIILLAVFSGFVAWVISSTLTRKLKSVSEKLSSTDVDSLDAALVYSDNDEIKPLVNSYNQMLEKLKEQKHQLQKNERVEAWKEMARQAAHEINNPLTPLRLTIQNFNRKYTSGDPDNLQKVKNLTSSIVYQIDLISSITKSFSDFAKMPTNNDSDINIVDIIKQTISIFPPSEVTFRSNVEELYYKMDGVYLTRILTNIVKNGLQAIPEDRKKRVDVVLEDLRTKFIISLTDNGTGISNEDRDHVFNSNFTTKSDGMGIGLSMVKKIVEDYKGKIWFESQVDFGTTFFVEFYKEYEE